MSRKIFNENMTNMQARNAFFCAIEGKTKSEIEQIKKEYERVIPFILKREMKLSSEGWIIN